MREPADVTVVGEAAALEYPLLIAALPADLTALHADTLALVMEPAATSIERLITGDLPPDALVMIDPNRRRRPSPTGQPTWPGSSASGSRTDVVKLSTEDLAYLSPACASPDRRRRAARAGARARAGHRRSSRRRGVPARTGDSRRFPAVKVVDTIGAGDAFGGAFLAWWIGNGLGRADLQQPGPAREALQAAVEVAALTTTRVGAEPPWRADVPGWGPRVQSATRPLPAGLLRSSPAWDGASHLQPSWVTSSQAHGGSAPRRVQVTTEA